MNQQPDNQQTSNKGYPDGNYNYPLQNYFQEENPINWKKYIFLFLRNWYWFLITLGIALTISYFKIKYAVPKYEASATLIIEEEQNSQDAVGQLRAVRYFRRQTDIANETAKLKSFSLMKRVVDSLNQDISWTAHGRIRIRPLYENTELEIQILSDTVKWHQNLEWQIEIIDTKQYRLSLENRLDTILFFNQIVELSGWKFKIFLSAKDPGYNTYSFVFNDDVSLAKSFKNKLQIETNEKEGTIIVLRSMGNIGELEVDFLNTLSSIYILSGLERKRQIAENTFTFIDDQIELILDSLKQAEDQLLKFRITNNVINLSREGEIAYERLKEFHKERTKLNMQENYLKYLQNYINDRNDPKSIIAPTIEDEGDQLLINALQELQALYEQRETLDFSAMTNNPGIERINERITAIRHRIIAIVNGLIENNQLMIEQVKTEELAILDQLKTVPLSEQQLLNIKRKYDLYNEFYTFLLQKRAEAGIQKASTIANVRILDPSRYDQLSPVGNDKMIVLLVSILLGLLTPSTIIILKALLDNRIREREDITCKTDIPIAGIIGHAISNDVLPAKEDPDSSFTESLRRIRSNLGFSLRNYSSKVILITSSVSGEGKTFCAANLATIIAMNNQKVILVGCDLRRPALHKVFKTSNQIGITSVIVGTKTLDEVIIKTSVPNLYILPSGPIPPNPAELIETNEMSEIFKQIVQDYDYVLIDTPPIALVADALSLDRYADLTLYIVRQNYSHKDVLQIANTMKEEKKLPNPFLLINDIKPTRSMGLNYYYGYDGGYNYGYYNYRYSDKYNND